MRTPIALGLLATLLTAGSVPAASRIEAIRGKEYRLSERHGPWMIMVASFRDVPKDRREEGLSADEAAAELVYELRQKGIPAYTHAQNAVVERIETVDRLGRDDDRIYAAQRDMISVVAGNYPSIDDPVAQKTLLWIKRYEPEFMRDESAGGIYRQSTTRKGPLSGAFMTINPQVKPEDVIRRKSDPDIVRMNNSTRFPLMSNKGEYTLQVATFTGRHVTPLAGSRFQGKEELFDRELENPSGYGLNRAGEDAEHLVAELRAQGVEAYVHHDRYESIVTIGSFASKNDSNIVRLAREYGPSYRPHPQTQQEVLQPYVVMAKNPADPNAPPLSWPFDLNLQVIPVPRYR
ncbi:hypothetical protein GC163_18645 [bacterium]|nr:hypothetical protein [bacterium]